ncbi:MAG: MvdD family ATP-grasp ribosomal peptide maturase, partial [Archangium sp.]|nr:MvdD family ATP-grasp ribosomal peptide maturase [Archangium sp.]
MKVLLVTRSDDNACVDWVARELKRRGHRAFRLDTDTYPQGLEVATELSPRRTHRRAKGTFDLESLDALWYRRFLAGGRLSEELGDTREACIDESRRTLYGTIAACRCFQLD